MRIFTCKDKCDKVNLQSDVENLISKVKIRNFNTSTLILYLNTELELLSFTSEATEQQHVGA